MPLAVKAKGFWEWHVNRQIAQNQMMPPTPKEYLTSLKFDVVPTDLVEYVD